MTARDRFAKVRMFMRVCIGQCGLTWLIMYIHIMAFSMSRCIEIPGVGCMFSVSTLVEICVDLCEIVRGYELKFLGRVLVLDLYVLGFQYFSVILVMEWLKEVLVKDFPDRF